MSTLTGTDGNDRLVFQTGEVVGFPSNSIALLSDANSDIIDDKGGDDVVDLRGTTQLTRFFCGSGKDTFFGGSGTTLFQYGISSDLQAGETIDGGSGDDFILIEGVSGQTYDFTSVSVRSIENITFNQSNCVVKFSAIQISSTGLSPSLQLTTFTDDAIEIGMGLKTSLDLSGWNTFEVTSTFKLSIIGDSSFETIVGSNVADIIKGFGGNDTLSGGDGADLLDGGDGQDTLDGGLGADEMRGGGGSDVYVVNDLDDLIVERFSEGSHDLVKGLGLDLRLSRYGNVEDATLLGSLGFSVIGSDVDNILTGNSGDNTLKGFDGNDRLDGQGGTDTMFGGDGDDFFIVDGVSDTIIERAGEGLLDEVATTVSFALGSGAEVEILRAFDELVVSSIDLTGNTSSQTIIGNAGANRLDDGGGKGVDVLQGKTGNDTYVIGNRGTDIVELAEDGNNDVAILRVSYALGADDDIEAMRVDASADGQAIKLTGNANVQTITGGSGDNTLDDGGGFGADTLKGLKGDDSYVVGNSATQIVELAGDGTLDRVSARVSFALASDDDIERLQTISASATDAIDLTGNGLAQEIVGNAGANRIDGKGGADRLNGLGGADTFAFSTLAEGEADTIVGFSLAEDRIALDRTVFDAFSAAGPLSPAAFRNLGTGPKDADDRILYDQTTGNLFYDADGSGTAAGEILFATISNKVALTADSFVVI